MNLSYLQIEANLKLASVKSNDILVVWSRDLGSLAGIDISDFQIGTSSDFEWDALQGYDFDEVVTFEGRWYQSLVAGIGTNTGNLPTNGLFWLQINKISGVIIPLWTPGLVIDHLTLFREGNIVYGLKDTVTLPFDSQTTPSADPTNWEPITSKLQHAYDVSDSVQILTNAIKGALKVRRGSASDTDNIYEGQNGAGTITFKVNGNGDVVLNEILANGSLEVIGTIAIGTTPIPNVLIGATADDPSTHSKTLISLGAHDAQTRLVNADQSTLNTPAYQVFITHGTDGVNAISYVGSLSPANGESALVFGTALSGVTAEDFRIQGGNIFIENGKLNLTDRLAFGLTIGDVASPLDAEEWYNDTLEKFRANEGGVVKNSIPSVEDTVYPLQFEISSDAPTSSFALFTGHIEVDTASEQLSGKLTDATYQTSLDDGDTLIDHATLSILQTWIDANITLPGTDFLLRTIGVYGVSKIGEAQVKFNYQIA